MDSQVQKPSGGGGGIVFKIIYLVGIVAAGVALFIPAKEGNIIENQNIANLFQAFTGKNADGANYVNMLFGHSAEPIGIPSVLLEILICFLPAALLIATGIVMFASSRRAPGLILGIAGTAIILGRDVALALTDTGFLGVYISMAGIVIAVLGLLLVYIGGDEEGEYVIAGVIQCRSGAFAGSSFEVADQVVIGKDPARCNIVLNNKTISRVHCIIRYLEESDSYTVKDVSSNGTYLSDGRRFAKNYEAHVDRGTEIYMGDPRETFYLD